MEQIGMNKLKKNYSTWAIFSLINNTKLSEKAVVGWRIVAGKKITVDLLIRVIRKFRNEIIVRAKYPKNSNDFSNLVVGTENLNIFLPDDMVLFQSKIKSIDRNGDVIISIPSMMAQIDRRKHLRLFVDEYQKVSTSFRKESHAQKTSVQSFKKSCFDISAGGFSFIISRIEMRYFEISDPIQNILLTLDEKVLNMDGIIVNILAIDPDEQNQLNYKGFKVCVKYTSIDSAQQKFIDEYVFNHIDLSDKAI